MTRLSDKLNSIFIPLDKVEKVDSSKETYFLSELLDKIF